MVSYSCALMFNLNFSIYQMNLIKLLSYSLKKKLIIVITSNKSALTE